MLFRSTDGTKTTELTAAGTTMTDGALTTTVSASTPAFSQVRLKRRRANSKGSFSRTLTFGIRVLVDTVTARPCGRAGSATPMSPVLAPPTIAKSPLLVPGIATSFDDTGEATPASPRGLLAQSASVTRQCWKE